MTDYKRKAIEGFPGYEIDTEGSVFSSKSKKEWRKLKPVYRQHGKRYHRLQITLWENNKGKSFFISRLVALTFIPNPNNYPQVCHKDSNPSNNNVDNLRWDTQQGNMDDRMVRERAGIIDGFARGEKVGMSKLNEKQVRVIKHILNIPNHISYKQIGRIFNVSSSNIKHIKYNKSWKHVTI